MGIGGLDGEADRIAVVVQATKQPHSDVPQPKNHAATPPDDVQLSAAAIESEAARGRTTALFALAAVLTISGSLVAAMSVTAKNRVQLLSAIHDHKAAVIAAACLFAIGTACTMPVLLHLAAAERMRRPRVPNIVVQLSAAGPLILALAIPLSAVLYMNVANKFASGAQTVKAADHLLNGSGLTAVSIVAMVGSIAAGFAWIMVGAYGIRIGLLTRPIGSLAVGVGLLTAIATNFLPPIVELLKVFELGAIAVMLVGTPEKRPPAWREGRVVAWAPLGAARAKESQSSSPD
jgi:hypothetical protein